MEALVSFVQFKKREKHLWKSGTKACNFNKSSTFPWVFSTFFKFYKWYQIVKSTSHWLFILAVEVSKMVIFTINKFSIKRQMCHCAIWYHLYNLKNLKITHGGVLILVKLQAYSTPPWVFFAFFKLYIWYQIAQNITNKTIRRKRQIKGEVRSILPIGILRIQAFIYSKYFLGVSSSYLANPLIVGTVK